MSGVNAYLQETYYFDFSDSTIQELVKALRPLPTHDKIGKLFLNIREQWRYNPFLIYLSKEKYKASFIVSNEEGHCIDKSSLFIACLRALGIPARLRLAKVINHIAAEGLTEKLGTHYIAPHGITEVFVNGQWLKASTAFNQTLCEKYNVDALYFDGTQDALLQPYNRDAQQYMEYVEDYGHFEDLPYEFILNTFKTQYPDVNLKVSEQGRLLF